MVMLPGSGMVVGSSSSVWGSWWLVPAGRTGMVGPATTGPMMTAVVRSGEVVVSGSASPVAWVRAVWSAGSGGWVEPVGGLVVSPVGGVAGGVCGVVNSVGWGVAWCPVGRVQ